MIPREGGQKLQDEIDSALPSKVRGWYPAGGQSKGLARTCLITCNESVHREPHNGSSTEQESKRNKGRDISDKCDAEMHNL